MSSRWASTADDAAATERRKEEKLQKKRLKDEKARQDSVAAATAQKQVEQDPSDNERPSKRRRVSPSPPAAPEAHLFSIPSYGSGPSASVNTYEILNAIEEGSYGKVSRARSRRTGEIVALKKLKINTNTDEGFPITGLREIQTLTACSHPHIIDLREVVVGLSLTE